MRLPVLQTDTVLHIGRLDLATKGRNSLEGHCLSVSLCPTAWRSIAQLGGHPLWSLTLRNAAYLDLHRVEKSKALRAHIEAWGLVQDYVRQVQCWRVWCTDEEGDFRYSLYATETAARLESGDDDEGPDHGPAVEPLAILAGTQRLADHVHVADLATRESFDLLALVWAESTQPAVCGVWWSETYDPMALSAPRGGIFPDRLSQFDVSPCSFNDHDDDETGEGLRAGFLPIHSST